jgi:hypothetical protein
VACQDGFDLMGLGIDWCNGTGPNFPNESDEESGEHTATDSDAEVAKGKAKGKGRENRKGKGTRKGTDVD